MARLKESVRHVHPGDMMEAEHMNSIIDALRDAYQMADEAKALATKANRFFALSLIMFAVSLWQLLYPIAKYFD